MFIGLLLAAVALLALRFPRVKLGVRRALHAALRTALAARSRVYAPPSAAHPVALVIAPHQDDGPLGCGGLVARKRRDGQRVHVVVVTDGSGSHPHHPQLTPEALAKQRAEEEHRALHTLGVEGAETTFLLARDGTLDRLAPAEAAALVARLAAALTALRPDEIFLPYRRDGSSEHEAAFRLVRSALQTTGLAPRLYEFPIWAWWSPVRLLRPLCTSRRVWRFNFAGDAALKRRALAEYRSQMEPVPPWTQPVLSPAFVSFFLTPVEYYFEL